MKNGDRICVNGLDYKVIQLLGHGKGGYSYLVEKENCKYVLKQIHHEPCPYYHFGNKIEAELHDYARLLKTGIRIPKLLSVDHEKEIIIKEFIDGPTISDLVKNGQETSKYIAQMQEMLPRIYGAGLNIDYYPTNFIVHKEKDQIYYIDYECNHYDPSWDFEHWGKKYWTGEEPITT